MKTREIAAAHVIYRTRDKYQNNQLKKGKCSCCWDGRKQWWWRKLVIFEPNIVELHDSSSCTFFFVVLMERKHFKGKHRDGAWKILNTMFEPQNLEPFTISNLFHFSTYVLIRDGLFELTPGTSDLHDWMLWHFPGMWYLLLQTGKPVKMLGC